MEDFLFFPVTFMHKALYMRILLKPRTSFKRISCLHIETACV